MVHWWELNVVFVLEVGNLHIVKVETYCNGIWSSISAFWFLSGKVFKSEWNWTCQVCIH